MIQAQAQAIVERRADVRLASDKTIEAVVLDQHSQPIVVLRHVEVINVSAGGLLILSPTPVAMGVRLAVKLGDRSTRPALCQELSLIVLECTPSKDDRQYRIRCQLVQGSMPAELIYNW